MKIRAYIHDGENHIDLRNSDEDIGTGKHMTISNISVYWNHQNIREGVNDTITLGTTNIVFEPGYWTFDMIKGKLLAHDIIIERLEYDGTCRIMPKAEGLDLSDFAPLIGFPEGEILTADVWETSVKSVDVNGGLRYVSIHSDIVKVDTNFNENGFRSDIAATIPITTTQSLYGSVSHYDITSKVGVYDRRDNYITFVVDTNIGHVGMDILFDVTIE